MRGVDRIHFAIISLLRCRQARPRRIERLLCGIEITLACVSLPLRGGVRVTQIQHILLSEFCVVARLFQFAVGQTGTVLPLLQRLVAVLHRRRHLGMGNTRD